MPLSATADGKAAKVKRVRRPAIVHILLIAAFGTKSTGKKKLYGLIYLEIFRSCVALVTIESIITIITAMRKLLLVLTTAVCSITAASAQTITFDSLSLPQADTFYVNYSNPGNDVGFTVNTVHFQCVYDTAFGGLWSTGFAYSNMTDSVTSGYTNMYAAKTAKGYNGSANYAVYWAGYGDGGKIIMPGVSAVKKATGFYITNSTYAYNSMHDGDFVAKKFGGTTGNDPDWFKLQVRGYFNGQLKADSVDFYLADFRDANNANDYIVKDWRWVDLNPLGNVDSLSFALTSSDNGSFGMNTPAYFCMDNFSTLISTGIDNVPAVTAKVYPNPATDMLHVELNGGNPEQLNIFDVTGKTVYTEAVNSRNIAISTGTLAPGAYLLQLKGKDGNATVRFVKQ